MENPEETSEEEVEERRTVKRTNFHIKGGPFGGFRLPSPREITDTVESIVSNLSQLREIPKTLVDHLTEADSEFRRADKLIRDTKFRRGRRRK